MKAIAVKQIMIDNNLNLIAGEKGLDKLCYEEMISRPGIELSGIFDFFDSNRIIFMGSEEVNYLNNQDDEKAQEIVKTIFEYNPPCIIFSVTVEIPKVFYDYAKKYDVSVLKSPLRTTPTSSKLYNYLKEKLSDRISVHGTLVNINGMGTLITGKSGIGKSEVTLELINKGHQLISDDLVEIFESEPGCLIGTAPDILKHYLEIRGIGVVNVMSLYGAKAYCEKNRIDLVVELIKWDDDLEFDRLGIEQQKTKYFNTEIPLICLPVSPGRNVSLLVEVAALNEKLKKQGIDDAANFVAKVYQNVKRGDNNDE